MANREQKRRMNKKSNKMKEENVKKTVKKSFFETKLGLNEEMASFVKTLIIVFISFIVVLLLTLLFGRLGVFDAGYEKPQKSETIISYEDILIGSTFNKPESTYYVIFDDFSKDPDQYLLSKLSGYTEYPLYKVDMSLGVNAKYKGETSNYSAQSASELMINGKTLIKIENHRSVLYLEGTDNIINELFN